MKKSLFLFLLLLPLMALPAFAQESRQDISLSESGIIAPYAAGNAVQLHSTVGLYGGLVSYRYLLTPHSGLELNYQYNQNVQHFTWNAGSYRVHDRIQEISGAYVRSFNFRNWNPFVEVGAAGVLFSPIDDAKTQYLTSSISRNTTVGALYGAGFAYEISPSFDIRGEYRGLILKTPTFNFPGNETKTNVYYNIFDPVIGIAYHF
ncbi:MAG TPA: outer membrane beta-barrel protein [Acidobacteriaceae bacterium]|nr:outer membrane beta-barrel protein [Acidobacteriaceae bacterium]